MECHGPSVRRGIKQGSRVQASGWQEIQKEKVDLKNFKIMNFVFNSTFRRCQRSEMDLEDLGHFGDAIAIVVSFAQENWVYSGCFVSLQNTS